MNIRPMKYTQNRKTLILIAYVGQTKLYARVYVNRPLELKHQNKILYKLFKSLLKLLSKLLV